MTVVKESRKVALTLANVLLPMAVLVFASGFFPYKPVLPGLATFDDEMKREGAEGQPEPVFKRVVFMVVDALRSDFVYGHDSGFDYTQSLIRSGAAIPFTAHATPPTVTMPRVKALTTGSVPSFLDLILNFAESDTSSSLAAQDTWLAQLKAQGGNLVFYGDDTWLKLFPDPNFFLRSDGTSSFFVSDFTEVDNNVTRHVPEELGRQDWSGMIMHYLGLDHIGHKTGPQGPNMLPKQREMDGIVKVIFEAMEREEHHNDTLLVLAGDHGMNAGGNHGGSGPGETEPALLFASPKFRTMSRRKDYECPTEPKDGTEFHFYTKVEQSDLVPTLAGLLGLSISRNSLGVSIGELAGMHTAEERRVHLKRNAEQIMQIIKATYGEDSWAKTLESMSKLLKTSGKPGYEVCKDIEGEKQLACLWTYAGSVENSRLQAEPAMRNFLLTAQEELSGTASSYNIPRMVTGMALTAIILALVLASFPTLWPSTSGTFFTLASILYGVMMFASSYVEEEQQFWYWLTPAWFAILSVQSFSRHTTSQSKLRLGLAVFTLFAVHRLNVRWNQTGQKHAGDPDIVHTVFPDAHVVMWLLIWATYSYTGYLLVTRAFAGLLARGVGILTAVVLILPAFVFKLNFTQADAPELVQGLAKQIRYFTEGFELVLQARVSFMALAVVTIVVIVLSILSNRESVRTGSKALGALPSLTERLHYLLTLFLITQTRAPNIPLLLGMELQREALAYILTPSDATNERSGSGEHVITIATSTLLLSHVTFFCTGGSNSISSIDLSNAYNGVADYNIVAVGVLLFTSNWTGPIWWCSAANLLLNTNAKPSIFASSERQKSGANAGQSWIDKERRRMHEDALKATMGVEKSASKKARGDEDNAWTVYVSCQTAFVATSLLAVMAACTALRTHLFIWTVFSPKYLYAMAWSVGWHLVVNVGLGGLLRKGGQVV